MSRAPFPCPEEEVRPEWIDDNGHMNLAFYIVIFDHATDAIFEALGIGPAYKLARNCGTFAVETHNLYERELRLGDVARCTALVAGTDAKRLHLAHEMFNARTGARVATQELMYLHVDLASRRTAPWPDDVRERLLAAAVEHAKAPRPDWIGRAVAALR